MNPRVLLCQLAVRTSKAGRSYMTGWLGKSRLIAFQAAEPDPWGNVCFDVYLQAVEERREEKRELLVAMNEDVAP